MISFNRLTKIFVCKEATDMRASYDTLFTKAKGVLGQDPFSGHLFVFINSKRSSTKCLFYDGTGFVILCKRIPGGLPAVGIALGIGTARYSGRKNGFIGTRNFHWHGRSVSGSITSRRNRVRF